MRINGIFEIRNFKGREFALPFFYVFAKDTQKSAMYDRTLYEGKSWFKIVKGNTFGGDERGKEGKTGC